MGQFVSEQEVQFYDIAVPGSGLGKLISIEP